MTNDCPICKHHLPGDCAKREDGYLKFPEDGCWEPVEKIKREVFEMPAVRKQCD